MSYAETMDQLNAKRGELARVRSEMRALQAQVEPQLVDDYVLAGWSGAVRLSELFAGKRDLIVIHNMGAGCPACTMWADGFNGVYDHLASRAAFVLASPDPVEAQKTFAASRGWRFPMVSYGGGAFAEDMRYRHRDGCNEDEESADGIRAFRPSARTRTAASGGSPMPSSATTGTSTASFGTCSTCSPTAPPTSARATATSEVKTMSYAETASVLKAKRNALLALHDEIRALQQTIEPQPVQDYVFEGWSGPVRLSELFAGKRDLFVIHNMGTSCRYCTMWADGFNGVYEHLADRAAFVLATPNTPDVQKQFARSRGWRFPMVSHAGNSFARDLGYRLERGDETGEDNSRWVPGVSAFQLRDGDVVRVSDAELGPGDDFCSVWHLLDMLPEGPNGWEPKFRYG